MVSIIPPIGPIDYTPVDPATQEPTYDSGSTTPRRRGAPTPYVPFTPPVDADGYIPVELIRPHVDPPNSFRATTVEDMYRIVPNVAVYWNDLETGSETGSIASFRFDTGVPSSIRSVIVTFQNRTLNVPLRVELDLPQYLRCELGTNFLVPHRGDTTTPPVVVTPRIIAGPGSIASFDPDRFDVSTISKIYLREKRKFTPDGQPAPTTDWEGSGKGITNVVLYFSDTQANLLNPGILEDDIIFKITPEGVTGPVYIDINAPVPRDLNRAYDDNPDVDIPRDDDDVDEPNEPDTPATIIEYVDRPVEVPVPDDTLRWIDGTTGETKEGFPPDGWWAGADGRMYPPLITDPCSDGSNAFPEPGVDPENLTELQELMIATLEQVSPSFGSKTLRQGYVIDVDAYFDGYDSERIIRRVPALAVADSVEDENKFAVLTIGRKWPDGTPTQFSMELVQWAQDVSYLVAYMKESARPPGINPFFGGDLRSIAYRYALRFLNGEQYFVERELPADLIVSAIRAGAFVAQLIEGIRANGEGKSWEVLRDTYEPYLDPYPGVLDSPTGGTTTDPQTGGTTGLTVPSTTTDGTSTAPTEEEIREKLQDWLDEAFGR